MIGFQPRFASTLANRKRIVGDAQIHPQFTTDLSEFKGKKVQPCVSATSCEDYDLKKVTDLLTGKNVPYTEIVPGETITFKYNGSDVFLIKFGTIVSWGIPEIELISEVVPSFSACSTTQQYKLQTEDMDFIDYDTGTSGVETEVICLAPTNREAEIRDKLAFSYAISRSTRLAVLEDAVETHAALMKDNIDKLSKGKKLDVSAAQVMKDSGRLLMLRGKLNLYSELIETPDIYWAEPHLEALYQQTSKVLDIDPRISILNRKLDYLSDESSALVDIMTHRKENYLEWIIIYLIVIEVCYETHHFIQRNTDGSEST